MKNLLKIKHQRRANRVRAKINGTSERPRLTVYRSNKHIYAQIIDDGSAKTIVFANDLDEKTKKDTSKSILAAKVGKLVAEKALKSKIKKVKFDRGAYAYHGRVKALAEAAREAGLEF